MRNRIRVMDNSVLIPKHGVKNIKALKIMKSVEYVASYMAKTVRSI